jgi:hypothetical protein
MACLTAHRLLLLLLPAGKQRLLRWQLRPPTRVFLTACLAHLWHLRCLLPLAWRCEHGEVPWHRGLSLLLPPVEPWAVRSAWCG